MTLKTPVPVELVHPIGLYPSPLVPSTTYHSCASISHSRHHGLSRCFPPMGGVMGLCQGKQATEVHVCCKTCRVTCLAFFSLYWDLRSAMKYSALRSLNTKEQIFFSQVQKWRRLYCSHFGCLMLSACCFTTLLLCLRARLLCAQMRVSHGFTTSNFVVFSCFLRPSNGGQSTCDISWLLWLYVQESEMTSVLTPILINVCVYIYITMSPTNQGMGNTCAVEIRNS